MRSMRIDAWSAVGIICLVLAIGWVMMSIADLSRQAYGAAVETVSFSEAVMDKVEPTTNQATVTVAEAWAANEAETVVAAAEPEVFIPISGQSLSDSEMLSYIISHESSGDPYATNGQYKGIGQLQESHYQAFVGMDYASTLQTDAAYYVQQQAMLGYISSRYGSIENAYYFWIGHGWY
jgi:hypothetical protein